MENILNQLQSSRIQDRVQGLLRLNALNDHDRHSLLSKHIPLVQRVLSSPALFYLTQPHKTSPIKGVLNTLNALSGNNHPSDQIHNVAFSDLRAQALTTLQLDMSQLDMSQLDMSQLYTAFSPLMKDDSPKERMVTQFLEWLIHQHCNTPNIAVRTLKALLDKITQKALQIDKKLIINQLYDAATAHPQNSEVMDMFNPYSCYEGTAERLLDIVVSALRQANHATLETTEAMFKELATISRYILANQQTPGATINNRFYQWLQYKVYMAYQSNPERIPYKTITLEKPLLLTQVRQQYIQGADQHYTINPHVSRRLKGHLLPPQFSSLTEMKDWLVDKTYTVEDVIITRSLDDLSDEIYQSLPLSDLDLDLVFSPFVSIENKGDINFKAMLKTTIQSLAKVIVTEKTVPKSVNFSLENIRASIQTLKAKILEKALTDNEVVLEGFSFSERDIPPGLIDQYCHLMQNNDALNLRSPNIANIVLIANQLLTTDRQAVKDIAYRFLSRMIVNEPDTELIRSELSYQFLAKGHITALKQLIKFSLTQPLSVEKKRICARLITNKATLAIAFPTPESWQPLGTEIRELLFDAFRLNAWDLITKIYQHTEDPALKEKISLRHKGMLPFLLVSKDMNSVIRSFNILERYHDTETYQTLLTATFHMAASDGREDIIAFLLTQTDALIPLHADNALKNACDNSHPTTVSFIASHLKDPADRRQRILRAIMYAMPVNANWGNVDKVHTLLSIMEEHLDITNNETLALIANTFKTAIQGRSSNVINQLLIWIQEHHLLRSITNQSAIKHLNNEQIYFVLQSLVQHEQTTLSMMVLDQWTRDVEALFFIQNERGNSLLMQAATKNPEIFQALYARLDRSSLSHQLSIKNHQQKNVLLLLINCGHFELVDQIIQDHEGDASIITALPHDIMDKVFFTASHAIQHQIIEWLRKNHKLQDALAGIDVGSHPRLSAILASTPPVSEEESHDSAPKR